MEFFGSGQLIDEEQRQKSLEFGMNSGKVDSMTIGFENIEQIADAIEIIMSLTKS